MNPDALVIAGMFIGFLAACGLIAGWRLATQFYQIIGKEPPLTNGGSKNGSNGSL